MFLGHVALLKAQYHHPMEVSEDDVMCLVLNGLKLDQQAFFFVVVMNNNCIFTMLPPFNYNLTFQL